MNTGEKQGIDRSFKCGRTVEVSVSDAIASPFCYVDRDGVILHGANCGCTTPCNKDDAHARNDHADDEKNTRCASAYHCSTLMGG